MAPSPPRPPAQTPQAGNADPPALTPIQAAFAKLLGRLLAEMYYATHANPSQGTNAGTSDSSPRR